MTKTGTLKKIYIIFTLFLSTIAFTSCVSISSLFTKEGPKITVSRNIMAPGTVTAQELADFFITQNPSIDREEIKQMAALYVYEGLEEGVNYALAFCQMCLETGYLRFGNLVTPEMHNYCGLGAMDAEHPGEMFPTMQLGIRAHIQHLQAYGTTEDQKLKKELVDPRYSWVHKTKFTQDLWGLSGTWATDPEYANKINTIICKLEDFINY